MKVRLVVDGSAPLRTRDGTVLGEIETVTVNFDVRALRAFCDGFGGTIGEQPLEVPLKVKDNPHSPTDRDAQGSFLPDPVEETWAVYVEALDRPRAVLTPKVRKWIRDAHEAVGPERTRDAIRGLAASNYHRENHYTGIEYAIVPKRGETIEGRVEKMAGRVVTNASSPVAGALLDERQFIGQFPPESQGRAERELLFPLVRMLQEPDNEEYKLEGRRRLKQIEGFGYEVVIENDRIVGYRKVA